MNFNSDEIRKAKEGKNNKDKEIVRKGSNEGLSRLREEMSISSTDDRIRSLTVRSIESVSEALEKSRKRKTEVVFIFDKSASCSGTEHDTIMGFYDVLRSEKAGGYNDIITTVLFDISTTVVHDRKTFDENIKLNYEADGESKSLYDAVCSTIKNVERKQCGEKIRTLVVIMTDGYDNSSILNDLGNTKQLIEQKRRDDWQFIFLGAMVNSKDVAQSMGIPVDYAEDYSYEQIGDNFKAIKKALEGIHEDGEVKSDWSKPIKENRRRLSGGNGPVKRLGNGR